jgi:cytochrome c
MKSHLDWALAIAVLSAAGGAFAAGDGVHGQEPHASRCTGRHSVDRNRIGPSHRGVYRRRAGRVADYDYSTELKVSTLVGSDKTLDAWLANPQRLIPGQKMGYSATDAADRADLIAYLRTLSPP